MCRCVTQPSRHRMLHPEFALRSPPPSAGLLRRIIPR
jgi:hypothetical protein